jgi:regulatory protein
LPPRRRGSRRGEPSEAGGAPGTPPSPVESAIRWLGPRLRFEREVVAFLRRQGFPKDRVAEAILRLKELGIVSDEETCRAFARDRLRFAPKGRSLLLAEMRAKGAAEEVAQAALDEVLPPGAEADAAAEWLRRSARRWRALPEGVARRRMWAALARRGFPREAAREALIRVAGEPPLDEAMSIGEEAGAPAEEEP